MPHPYTWSDDEFVFARQYAALMMIESEESGNKYISITEDLLDE